jgi:SAM-dependent methyltransferase
LKIKQHKLSEIQKNTRDIYERLFFEHSSLSSPEVTAEGRAQFHEVEYLRVLGLKDQGLQNQSILETGCGPGSHSLILSNLIGENGRLRSFDLSDINVAKAEALLAEHNAPNNYRFSVSAAENFSVINEPQFDIVMSHNWLHHSDDPLLSLFNILKPLKIGGKFYLCTYQACTFRALIFEFIRRRSLLFDQGRFLKLTPFFFPGGFSQFNFYQIIHYENLIDDYLVPRVRFAHIDHLSPTLLRGGLEIISSGVSSILLRPDLFDVEEIPLKVGFTKIKHFETFNEFSQAIGGNIFTETVPRLPAEYSHLSDLVDCAFNAVTTSGLPDGEMFLAMALHGLRCQFATSHNNTSRRFFCLERMLKAVVSGNNSAYSLHAPDEWSTKSHPLADEIIKTTPSTKTK